MTIARPGRRSVTRRLKRALVRLRRRVGPEFASQRGPGWVSYRGERTALLRRGSDEPRRGIYLRGACDVPSMFTLAPLVVDDLQGTLCIHMSGRGVSDARSDLLLQTWSGVPDDFAREVRERFDLPPGYFAPTLFEPTFTVPGLPDPGPFPKTVVVLSVLPDLTRTMYRHRETGYLVDPGAAWLNRLSTALADTSFVRWFNERFESMGRLTPEAFAASYRELIPAIRKETGAHVLVLNSLEIEPFDPTHDYSVRNLQSATRRRRFNIALAELSRELDFHVVDVDRVLKENGVERQVDFSHFPGDRMRAVGAEARRILRGLQVV